jgi:hypothetical protein
MGLSRRRRLPANRSGPWHGSLVYRTSASDACLLRTHTLFNRLQLLNGVHPPYGRQDIHANGPASMLLSLKSYRGVDERSHAMDTLQDQERQAVSKAEGLSFFEPEDFPYRWDHVSGTVRSEHSDTES